MSVGEVPGASMSFVWLEVTGRCELNCLHCYADSGPGGDHGLLSEDDWTGVIDQVRNLGGHMVQIIAGEQPVAEFLLTLSSSVV